MGFDLSSPPFVITYDSATSYIVTKGRIICLYPHPPNYNYEYCTITYDDCGHNLVTGESAFSLSYRVDYFFPFCNVK